MLPQGTSAEPEAPADPLGDDRQQYRRVLNGLIEIGADFARLLHQKAKAQAQIEQSENVPAAATASPEISLPDLTIAFDRVARAIRRTVALAQKLAEPIPGNADSIPNRVLARKRIIREVEDHIQRKPRGPEAETLQNELFARLDSPDLEDDIENRPVAEIIADICHDLGLTNLPGSQLWKRRTPDDVASLCARAAMPRMKRTSPIPVRPKPPHPHPGADPPWRPQRVSQAATR